MNNNHKTQKRFFEVITQKKFNELLKRADKSTKVFETHINQQLSAPLQCKSKVNNNQDNYCDIIINYLENNVNIGHFTIHCKMDDTTMKPVQRRQGRIHLKNTKNTCYTMKCNSRKLQNANSSVTLSYAKYLVIHSNLKECIDVTLNILNMYIDFNSILSLDIPMTNYESEVHPCTPKITSNFGKTYKTRFRRTERASIQARKLSKKAKNTIQHV